SKIPTQSSLTQGLEGFERLEPKDLFLAITTWDDAGPKTVGGFRFKGRLEDADQVLVHWRDSLQKRFPNATQEVVEYEEHQIHTITILRQTMVTAVDKHWVFAANSLDGLKAILDRADHRIKDRGTTLAADEMFSSALKHMPSTYVTLL